MRPEQIPYGVKDFKRIRLEGFYYIDKSQFVERLECRANFLFFVRPRRFGKTMLCEMLRCYYDVAEKDNFEQLFGGLYAGSHPTKNANRYFVLSLDFSRVNVCAGTTWGEKFESYMDNQLDIFISEHRSQFASDEKVMGSFMKPGAETKFAAIAASAHAQGLGFYVIVDEYDNFTNEIVSAPDAELYREITHGTGFYRGWFKQFKATCDRIFMTGVSPVTMDDLTSGFNIATNISLESGFHSMVGFTTEETRKLFYDFCGTGRYCDGVDDHLSTVKKWYDSYCFAEEMIDVESLYNCDMVLYYLSYLVANGKPPKSLVDANIRSDWNKLAMILAAQRHAATFDGILPLTEELVDKGEVTFDLVDSFPIETITAERNFKSLYYYYGIVTMGRIDFDTMYFRVPNECVRRQIFEYMRGKYADDSNHVDLVEFQRLFVGFARDGEWNPFLTYLADRYRVSGCVRDGIDGEARINGFIRAYLAMKSNYLVRPEFATINGYVDYALFPDPHAGPATPRHSYLIELKYAPKNATDAQVAANHQAALEQLAKYAADPNLSSLANGSTVHFICFEFKGRDLVRLEEARQLMT